MAGLEELTRLAQRLRQASISPGPVTPLAEAARRAATTVQGSMPRRPPRIVVRVRGNTVSVRGTGGGQLFGRYLDRELARAHQEIAEAARRQIVA